MKKLISVVLAVLMISAICVPAFAAPDEQTITTPKSSEPVVVKVKEDSLDAAEWYVVKIPADKEIAWDTTSVDMSYSVACQLEEGKSIDVTVTDSNSNKMTDTEGGDDTIAFTPTGFTDGHFDAVTGTGTSVGDASPVSHTVTLSILPTAWDGIAISVYQTTLTYTVAVNNPA